MNTTTTTTTTAIIRAHQALNLHLQDRQYWSCDAPVYKIPAALPAAVTAWIARHPEAAAESSGWVPTAASLESWKAKFQSVRYVLDAPAKHRAAAKRAYRRSLGLVG
jgi:hypothetical protein